MCYRTWRRPLKWLHQCASAQCCETISENRISVWSIRNGHSLNSVVAPISSSWRKFEELTACKRQARFTGRRGFRRCGGPAADRLRRGTPKPAAARPPTASDYTGCIVSDSGGFDDQSFNQSSYEGLKKAEKDLGIKVNQVESKTNNDFEPNLRAMVTAGCDLTVTVGFLLGDATKAQADGQPGQPLRHHRLRLRHADRQRQADHLRHGPGCVHGRLPRRRLHEDRHGRHLRRHQDPHRHHLHGRLRGRREVLQRAEGQGRQAPRLGQGKPRTAASPATSKSRTRASSSPRTSWTRARTLSCPWPARWARAPARR